jgi:hypothetical protein
MTVYYIWNHLLHELFHCLALKNYNKETDPLNAELSSICHLLALLEAHHIIHISRIRVDKTLCFGDKIHEICITEN